MQQSDNSSPKPLLVGIGASAGGLDALKGLLSQLPADSGLAFVIVVHLSPEKPSLLADVLQPFTAIPVSQVTEDTAIEPDHVYVIPPGSNLATIDSHLRLSDIEAQRSERTPIDFFFETLATTHGEHCIGIVLSGTGADGSLGIKKIKEHGGLSIVQDPNQAGFDGMPQNAIATRLVDIVLPVEQMADAIIRFARHQPKIPEDSGELGDSIREILRHIFAEVRARTAHDFSRYKQSTVLRRIRRRMQLHGLEEPRDYLGFLRDNPSEVHLLAEEFLVTVTQFFRDSDTFAYLQKELLPQLFAAKTASDRIRVWSVGCATGEEAYTLAMLMLEQAEHAFEAPQIEIFATDLHEASLRHAREGCYPDTIEADVSASRLNRFFAKSEKGYCVNKQMRETVVFANHNLLRDPPFSRLDLIVCRNMLIYLQRDAQKDVIDLFHYALNPDGLLLLGPSETIERNGLFRRENKQHCVFRRRNVPAPEPRLPVFPYNHKTANATNATKGAESRTEPGSGGYGNLHQKMVERYALPSILVDADFRIVHASEHAGRYLQVRGGEPSPSLFKLLREELRIETRSALDRAHKNAEDVRVGPLFLELDGKQRQLILHVRPSRDAELSGFNLIIFDEMDVTPAAIGEWETASKDCSEELERTQERLGAVIEQYETSQEEMRASNEELQSANEELRSTMEELETSKEELQSMNEELQTVNQENRHKVEELSQLSSDLNNLMAATEIAVLFLDRHLRIIRTTPRTGVLFNIRSSDRGRPLTDLRHRLGYDHLEEDARQVLERLTPVEREVQAEGGEWYLCRVLPYRTMEDQIRGVVITLVEVTALKQAELALRNSEERFRALVNASAQIVWTTDAEGQVVEDSPSWRDFTGQSFEQWRGSGWADAVHPEDRERAREEWTRSVREAIPLETEFRLCRVDGQWRWTHVRAVPLRDERDRVRGWVGMNTDITARKEAEQALKEQHRRKDEFLAMLGHELRNPLAPIRTALHILEPHVGQEAQARQAYELIRRQTGHMVRLVDDLLDINRITHGKIHLHRERVELQKIIQQVLETVRPKLKQRDHDIKVELPAEPVFIDADPLRLTQIFFNLLDNADKYTPNGGPITLHVDRKGEEAVVRVIDTGIGIATEDIPRVFEVFSEVGAGGEEDDLHVGLGIGLWLTRALVEMHGGRIEASSAGTGQGSEFTVHLPVASPPPAASEAETGSAQTAARDATALVRVLIADDEPANIESLQMLIESAGHEVFMARNGLEAVSLAQQKRPDIILMDLAMPKLDGTAACRQIRQLPGGERFTIIALTGWADSEHLREAAEEAFDEIWAKPVDPNDLLEWLQAKKN